MFEYLYNCLSDVFHRAEGLLHVAVAKDYSCQVLQGLVHLHSHQVAHRDLSMGNILLDIPSNTLKIADLGLASSLRFTFRFGQKYHINMVQSARGTVAQ